jgi:F-type H+-transporting ATPase subunit a
MVATVVVASAFLYEHRQPQSVPGRLQSVSEMAYEFVGNMLRDAAASRECSSSSGLAVHVRAVANLIGLFPFSPSPATSSSPSALLRWSSEP